MTGRTVRPPPAPVSVHGIAGTPADARLSGVCLPPEFQQESSQERHSQERPRRSQQLSPGTVLVL